MDELPARVDLPRRCAFRFLELEVLDTSPKYRLLLQEVRCVTESSADLSQVTPLSIGDGLLERIDRAGLRTLADCTQEIFEDGPKRDQRLWMGDLRLQALASYASFRSLDLVRRCLYLFAGTRFPDGRISACVFTKPAPEADDTWLLDYSLFFPVALEEYLEERDDPETLEDLYPAAMEQIDLIRARFTDGILPRPEDGEATFVDWCDGLDKRACAQAILLYAARHGRNLARRMGDREREADLTVLTERLEHGARETFWDPEQGFFVSGGQISIASQVWMILAGVLKPEEARDVMERSDAILENFPMQTPYMHHYYVSALLQAGLAEKALAVIRDYWGGMLEAGADTFWEAWDPAHPDGSPYGGLIVNSFCHAWSCTPVYLLRRCFSGSPQAKEAPQES